MKISPVFPWCVAIALLPACASAPPPSPPEPPPPQPPPAAPPAPKFSPVDPALPSIALPSLPQRATCPYGNCAFNRTIPYDLQKGLVEHGEAMLWEQLVGAKSKVLFPPDKGADVAGVVLEGIIGVVPLEAPFKAEPTALRQWGGFHAPGGGVTLTAIGGKAARIALLVAVHEAEGSLAKHVERLKLKQQKFSWKERGARFETFDFAAIPPSSWGHGAYHARVGWDATGKGGAPDGAAGAPAAAAASAMSMSVLLFSKDAPLAPHAHDRARECLTVLQGTGDVVLLSTGATEDAAPTERPLSVEPGMTVCLPPGVSHAWKPAGGDAFLAVQVFSPPGAELNFKKLAGKETEHHAK